jgi:hypothetical protein
MDKLKPPYVLYYYIYKIPTFQIIIQNQNIIVAVVAIILVGEARKFKYFPLLDINTIYFYLLYLVTRT